MKEQIDMDKAKAAILRLRSQGLIKINSNGDALADAIKMQIARDNTRMVYTPCEEQWEKKAPIDQTRRTRMTSTGRTCSGFLHPHLHGNENI